MSGPEPSLRGYLDVLLRRKRVVIAALLAAPAAALLLSLRQPALYRSSAEVLLDQQSITSTLTNTSDPSAYLQPDRFAQTEVDLARQEAVAVAVVQAGRPAMRAAGVPDWTDKDFLAASSALVDPNSNLLELRVSASDKTLAERLASTYAYQFTAYRSRISSASYERAATQIESALKPLKRAHLEKSALYLSLSEKLQQVRTLEALQTPSNVVRASGEAVQVQPRPKHALVLGVLIGGIIGVVFAFGWEALDPRIRSVDEISERLGLPLLARVPQPARSLGPRAGLVTTREPGSVDAEAFRLLRANLDFVNREVRAKTIMITSAVPSEGKSTTVANLAASLTRIGRRVALVDLDLRQPTIHNLLDITSPPGLANVVRREVPLATALRKVPIGHGDNDAYRRSSERRPGDARSNGASLDVLTAGATEGQEEIAGSPAIADVLHTLGRHADIVLIDGPPLLVSSDALTLSSKVDGIVVVTKLGISKQTVSELRHALDVSGATVFGVVVTGTDRRASHPYYQNSPAPESNGHRSRALPEARPVEEPEPEQSSVIPTTPVSSTSPAPVVTDHSSVRRPAKQYRVPVGQPSPGAEAPPPLPRLPKTKRASDGNTPKRTRWSASDSDRSTETP